MADSAAHPPAAARGPSATVKTFDVRRKGLSAYVVEADGAAVMHAELKRRLLQANRTPNLLLHGGPDESAPVTCAATIHHGNRTVDLHLDAPGAAAPRAEAMKAALGSGTWRLALPEGGGAAPAPFAWERTHSSAEGVTGASKLSMSKFRLVDGRDAARTLAFWDGSAFKSWGVVGRLEIRARLDPDMERWVVLSCVAMVEAARRRNNAAAAGGAGGGGGA